MKVNEFLADYPNARGVYSADTLIQCKQCDGASPLNEWGEHHGAFCPKCRYRHPYDTAFEPYIKTGEETEKA